MNRTRAVEIAIAKGLHEAHGTAASIYKRECSCFRHCPSAKIHLMVAKRLAPDVVAAYEDQWGKDLTEALRLSEWPIETTDG